MGESPVEIAEEPALSDLPDADAARPHLRLHHLFVLTAVMAVLLAIHGPQQDVATGRFAPPPLLRTFMFMTGIMSTILSAGALTALGYGIAWYRRGLAFFDQPGHWLLAELSLTALLGIVPSVAYRWMGYSQGTGPGDPRMVAISMLLTAYMVLFIFIGRSAVNFYLGKMQCVESRWKYVFYLKAIAPILLGLGGLLVIPITLSAAQIDRRDKVPRDPSHWCGVALQLAASTLTIVMTVITIYFMFTAFRQ